MKKHFGIEFRETDKGFQIEFTGDEETIKARKEAVAAWRDFVTKARKAGFPCSPHSFVHALHHHGMHHHHGPCCWDDDDQDNTPAENTEQNTPKE
ncbi:MAG TPA: hypothetical protein VHQ46_02780 [Desulfobacteria bacterium]|nr:hypothetical protein [Desulfobacteria bacterium]